MIRVAFKKAAYMQKISSETDRFLKALRGQHNNIYESLGDAGVYGAMSNYTGDSHLTRAMLSGAIPNVLSGAGVGALSSAYLLPMLGAAVAPPNYYKAGAIAGAGMGLGLGALSAIAKYYLGKTTAGMGQE